MVHDLRRLAALREVGRRNSFSAAADALHLTQSAVSQQIAVLELQVGITLVHRTPGDVRLTEAGEVLSARASDAFAHLAAAEQELDAFRGLHAGRLRVGAFATAAGALVPRAVAAVHATYPSLPVEIRQLEPPASVDALKAGELDVAVLFSYPLVASAEKTLGALEVLPLLDEPVLVALSARHRLAAYESVPLAELAGEHWVVAPDAGLPLEALARASGQSGFVPGVRFDGDDFAGVLGLVAAGLGIAVVPEMAARGVRPGVALRRIIDPAVHRSVVAARLVTRHPSPAVTATLDALSRAADVPHQGC